MSRTERRPHRASLARKLRIEVHAAWLSARDPRTPWPARAFGIAVTAYALSPIDLIPDFIPILGLVDDAILVPAGLWLFVRMLPPGLFEEKREVAEQAADRPGSAWGALLVLTAWIVTALLLWQLWSWRY